jgi:hypothetical protein
LSRKVKFLFKKRGVLALRGIPICMLAGKISPSLFDVIRGYRLRAKPVV